MFLRVLGSSSAGNQYVLENNNGNQLLIECGLRYDKVANHINFSKVQGLIISHAHNDHCLEKQKFELVGIDIYDHTNLVAGKKQTIGDFEILPIPVNHGNEPTFSFIIKDKPSNKKILFCTDLEQIPNIADTHYEIMLLEANFSQEIVNNKIINGDQFNRGCFTHNSLENLIEWLKVRKNKPENLVLIHLSNSSLIHCDIAIKKVKEYAKNCYIAKSQLEIRC